MVQQMYKYAVFGHKIQMPHYLRNTQDQATVLRDCEVRVAECYLESV